MTSYLKEIIFTLNTILNNGSLVIIIWILWYHVSGMHTPLEKWEGTDAQRDCGSMKQYVAAQMDVEYGEGQWGTLTCEELPVGT